MKPSKALILSALLVAFASLDAQGQTTRYVATDGIDVISNDCSNPNNPCETIQYAHNVAAPGDTIQIESGVYDQSLTAGLHIFKSITLDGAGPNQTIIQANDDPDQATHRVIEIESAASGHVNIHNVTIRHGNASGSGESGRGGGVYLNGSTVNFQLIDVIIENNKARVGGGLIKMGDSHLQMSQVIFRNNQASQRGGGIYNQSGSFNVPIIYNAEFENNSALLSGGGIYNEGGVVPMLDNVVFLGNTAGTHCGGMCLQTTTGNFNIENTEFIGNTANDDGGGLFVRSSSPTLRNVTFVQNEAQEGRGGGIYLDQGSSPLLEGATFTGNQATWGGGMANVASSPEIDGAIFNGNSALKTALIGGSGGGMFNTDGSAPVLSDVVFSANHAESSGGGMINAVGSAPVLTDVTFDSNWTGQLNSQGGGAGGGMYNGGVSAPTLMNVIFQDNVAYTFGGGMFNSDSSPLLVNVRFSGNSTGTGYSGGGMGNSLASSPVLWNVSFNGNSAAANGGGIFNGDGSGPVLHNTILWGNMAGSVGDEIHNTLNGSASLHFSLHANSPGDIHDESGSNFTCSDCLHANPMFVNAAAGNLQLSEGSPAIDTGDPNTNMSQFPGGPASPKDLAGSPRVWGGTIDIGAYEFFVDDIFSDRFESQ